MSSTQQQLMTALNALDRAFACEEPFPVQGCLYCYGEQDLAELSGPLHLMSDRMVSSVASREPSHWDDFPRLYRRLIPRIIRSVVTGQLHVDENLIATRLLEAGWSTWDQPLADALRDVWSTWWRTTLHTHPSPISIRDTLSLITVATNTLRPWLDMWTATHTPAADAHLADLIDDVMFEFEITDLRMGFYDEYHATAELLGWLLTDVRDRVNDARLDDPYLLAYHRTAGWLRDPSETPFGPCTLEEIEGVSWPDPPADATRLIATAHALRHQPMSALSPEDLRLLIRQNISLPYLLPRAIELLSADPLVEGDLYEGDLLSAVLTRDRAAWAGAPHAARALRLVLSTMNDIPPGLQGEVDDFLALPTDL